MTSGEYLFYVKYDGMQAILVIPPKVEILTPDLLQYVGIDSVHFEPDSQLVRIEAQSFVKCASLRSICIPASVEYIGQECFAFSKGPGSWLESLTFEAGSKLRQIGESAFAGCRWLHSIYLPASVSEIDGATFVDSAFSDIGFEPGNKDFCVDNHFVFDFARTCMVRHFGPEDEVRIPDGIETIGRSCFAFRAFLQSVSFDPQSKLRCIGASAFEGCSGLEAMHFLASVQVVKERAFRCCRRLSQITFARHSQLTWIESGAFASCSALRSLEVPSSVEFVGECCFARCSSLSRFTFEQPSHLSAMHSLPTAALSSVDIPDSVEVFKTCIENADTRLTIGFGEGSRLAEIRLSQSTDVATTIGAFVRLPSHRLKVLRCEREFA
jgi:hypothetical protein